MLNPRRRHSHSGDRNAWSCQEMLIRPEVFRSAYDRDRQREKNPRFRGSSCHARGRKNNRSKTDITATVRLAKWNLVKWLGRPAEMSIPRWQTREIATGSSAWFPACFSDRFRSSLECVVPRYESDDKSCGTARDFCNQYRDSGTDLSPKSLTHEQHAHFTPYFLGRRISRFREVLRPAVVFRK